MIETITTYRNGESVRLWRCAECTSKIAQFTGKPVRDNGFVELDKPLIHVSGCPFIYQDYRKD